MTHVWMYAPNIAMVIEYMSMVLNTLPFERGVSIFKAS